MNGKEMKIWGALPLPAVVVDVLTDDVRFW